MTTYNTDYANGVKRMPEAQGAEVVVARMSFDLTAALALDDIIRLGALPPGHVPVDAFIDSDDLDSNGSPAIDLELGILNAAEDDIDTTASGGAAWTGTDDIIAQSGGLSRADIAAITRVVPDASAEQMMGIHVTTAPATGATSGTIGVTVLYRATHLGA